MLGISKMRNLSDDKIKSWFFKECELVNEYCEHIKLAGKEISSDVFMYGVLLYSPFDIIRFANLMDLDVYIKPNVSMSDLDYEITLKFKGVTFKSYCKDYEKTEVFDYAKNLICLEEVAK